MPVQTLTQLYDLHLAGQLEGHDPRWADVDQKLRCYAELEIPRIARNLYGETLERLVDEVHGSLLAKFINKKLNRTSDSIDPLLKTATRNDLMSALRRQRSPTGVGFDGAEATWEDVESREPDQSYDVFAEVRRRLEPFRFPEYELVREALLAFFLTPKRDGVREVHTFPGAPFLHHFGVGRDCRVAVYNAAVFDINRAMMAYCDES